MMRRYAASTEVPADRSRVEIERTLSRYGANGFAYGWEEGDDGRRAVIGFRLGGKQIRFELRMPSADDHEYTVTDRGRQRSSTAAALAWEQATRQRWRALSLVVKAKLEAVSSGIATFEDEFLSYLVLPDGRTVGSHVLPAVERAYATGKVRGLLPAAVADDGD